MKTNYKLMTFLLSAIFVMSSMAGYSQTATTVFSDDFNRADISPGGDPEVTYTVFQTGTAVPIIESSIILRLPNVANENARTTLTASTVNFAHPFNTIIETIDADSIVWTFNIRQNYNGRLTGIDDAASRGIAAVLLASSSDLSAANGYALVNGGAAPINYRLVKFAGGLYTAANITELQQGQTLSDNRVYTSIKVVFIPATKTWKLYDRVDGSASGGAYADPESNATPYVFAGSVVDATYTGVALNAFGFTHKYSAATSFNMWVDNYKVTAYTTEPTSVAKANAGGLAVYAQGRQIAVRGGAGTATVYNSLGQKLCEQALNGVETTINRYFNAGVYIVKADNKTVKVIMK
ncbi:MAG: T9SS type A sorting domain-containing protein [Prevotella sp.]|jgi:hypothetical protein|nr:T9SS type A sorting domain-containing protein [Prevotella sp.]